MVEDRITDGKRIGQVLASELSGLETGPLADLTVTDADPDATPTREGTRAYAVEFGDGRVGRASLYPETVVLELDGGGVDGDAVRAAATGPDLDARPGEGATAVHIASGAAVKRAVDALVAGLDGDDRPEQPGDGG